MSLSRKTYSPMSHTYSYSSTISPTYSYSRVTSYLDALERDETIQRLKKEVSDAKSLEMKYHALLQEISMAEKENKLLQSKNTNIEQDYVQKIQQIRDPSIALEKQLHETTKKLLAEEQTVSQVEQEINALLSQLKDLEREKQQKQMENSQLQNNIKNSTQSLSQLTKQKQLLSKEKATFQAQTKESAFEMEKQLQNIIQANEEIRKNQQELQLLNKQLEAFKLETQNAEVSCGKNTAILQNLERKITIQKGENQQLKSEVESLSNDWKNQENKVVVQKQALYKDITKVQEQTMLVKSVLSELANQLDSSRTQKRYLRDITAKKAMTEGQNQQLRERIRQLTMFYMQKKTRQSQLVEEINKKLSADKSLKKGIDQRSLELNTILQTHIGRN